ncbi:hypothetical protein GY45DRAFT_1376252 [Cubamyces sp. BRFM 1775]|nr:hypothetical protein GY45DRAFT_1376252 [Cubamyces sp. BRFM 1775]
MDSVNAPSSAIDYQFYSGATGPRAVDYANRLPSHFSDDDAEESDNARSSIRMMDTVQARLPDSGFRAVSVRSVSPASDIQIIEHPQANAEATAVRVLRTLASRAGSALRGTPPPVNPPVQTQLNRRNSPGEGSRRALPATNLAPVVVVPPGMPLTSTVTYSNVPGGYDAVSRARECVPLPLGHERVLVPKKWIRFLENPDSVALLVVSPSHHGAHVPHLAVTHRKLRFLFKTAVDWYLKEHGVAVGDVDGTFVRVNRDHQDDAERDALLPITYVNVVGEDYDFYTPSMETLKPSAGVAFITVFAFATVILFAIQAGFKKAFASPPPVPHLTQGCPFRTALAEVVVAQDHVKSVAMRALGRGLRRLDAFLANAREQA